MSRNLFLLRVLCILLMITMPGALLSMDPVPLTSTDLHKLEQEVQQYVNIERIARHIPQLNWNDKLACEARRHAESIVARHFLSHEDPVRGNVDRRLDASGISWHRCAENIYAGNPGGLAEKAIAAWRQSPGHCRTMLDSMLSEAGVGIAAREDGTIIVVQDFILK